MSAAESATVRVEGPCVADAGRYGRISVVGGGCYGSYYVRQLRRARKAGTLDWNRLVVVDRNARCRVALETAEDPGDVEIAVEDWAEYFARYLGGLAATQPSATPGAPLQRNDASESPGARHEGETPPRAANGFPDALVPSPLMPHLLFDWLAARARARWPQRRVESIPLPHAPPTPWERASPSGTHYVSFAEWICPVNCIEPARCPHTRGPRSWSMPDAARAYVVDARARGIDFAGPVVFHCTHRAYGVGMIDVAPVLAGDALIAELGTRGPARVLVGTMSHCHGALDTLAIGP